MVMEMKIPEDYKQTEMGMIPKNWDFKQIGEIAIVSSGGTPNRSNPSYWNGNIPWITTSQIEFNTIIYANEFITKLGVQNSAAKLYAQNTLLMAMYGQGKTRGKVAILGIDATINQACAAITLNKDVLNNYIFFYLAHNYEEIRKLSNTGNQENLNGNIIKSIFVPLPPLPEQKAIAQSLSDVDALITTLDQLITKKRNIKQGTMQQLLTGKKRLPGFSGEWVVEKLGEIGEFKNGINKGKEDFGFGYPFVNLLDVFGKAKVLQGLLLGFVNSSSAERKIYELRKGDVLFIRSSVKPEGVGLTSLVNDHLQDTVYSGFLIRFRDFGKLYFEYKVHCFNEEKFRKRIMDSSTVSANTNINQDALKNIQISLPPTQEEQKAIAQILSDMDAEIEALEQKRDKYKAIKQGMMQELLTGKTRITYYTDN